VFWGVDRVGVASTVHVSVSQGYLDVGLGYPKGCKPGWKDSLVIKSLTCS
jgi:hypothetical protein